jgi:hypothetical protein
LDHIDLRIPFGIGRELRNGLGWNRWTPSITSEHAGFVAIGAMSRMKIEAGFLVSVALIAQLDAREETRLPGKGEAGSSELGRVELGESSQRTVAEPFS